MSNGVLSTLIRDWVKIAGHRVFIAAMTAGFCAGVAVVPLAANELRATLIALGALCIMAATARRAHVAESSVEDLRTRLQNEESYHAFVQSSVEGFFRTTYDGRYIKCNPALARIYGYQTEDELTQRITDIASTLYVDPNRRMEFASQIKNTGIVQDFVSQVRRHDGTLIWISENARRVAEEDGQFLYYEGTVQDITAKIEAERAIRRALEETEEAARAKAAFLAAMSHELKTPLNAVMGFSDLMLQEIFGPLQPQRYRAYVKDIHDNALRLLAKINDILDLSRVGGGLMTLAESEVGVEDEVREAWASVSAKTNPLPHIRFDIPDGLPALRADPKHLHQLLCHILSNAVKFMPDAGEIRIRARLDERGGMKISIEDQGIGMTPEHIVHALEPFKQLDGRLARRFEGVGLGLPLANALAQLHGGHISIESVPGVGTTVTIGFPPERTRQASVIAA